MLVQIASESAGPGLENEDFAAVVPGGLVVLDGAAAPAGLASGCCHSVAWYARALGGQFAGQLTDTAQSLAGALAVAISTVNTLHGGNCDLASPHSPSATAAAVRVNGDRLEYLLLSDSTLIVDRDGEEPLILSDNRLQDVYTKLDDPDELSPLGSSELEAEMLNHVRSLGSYRNQPDGFWVASTLPEAAHQAITGSLPLGGITAVALLTDGATRIVDGYELLTWDGLLSVLRDGGPAGLIAQTRAAEASDPNGARWPRSKASDDATAVYWDLRL